MAANFNYHSEQVHTTNMNGISQEKRNIVNIKNGKGTKTVEVTENGKTNSSTKKLSQSEISQIEKGKFIPNLWKPCNDCLRKGRSSRKTRKNRKGSR